MIDPGGSIHTSFVAGVVAVTERDRQAAGDEAEDLLQRTLRAREETLGPTHSDTLTSKNNLADLIRAAGSPDQAEQMLNEVLRARRSLLGDPHNHASFIPTPAAV